MADDLLGGWHPESIERIAARAASMAHDKILPFGTRLEVALAAICDMLTETEWEAHRDGRTVEAPEVKALYAAVNRAIAHESYLYRRDHAYVSSLATDHEMGASRNWQAFWVGGTHPLDPVGEAVAEKVAIRQALRGLKFVYAQSVYALADAIRDGGDYHLAAARLGISDTTMHSRLSVARRFVRQHWVAPGETPRPNWGRDRGRNSTVTVMARRVYANREKRKAAAGE